MFISRRPSRRLVLGTTLAVLLAAVLVTVGYVVWARPTQFERATSQLPAQTLRVTWTDWADVRAELGGSPSYQDAVDRDLTVSSLASSTEELQRALGFSPMEAEWELMGQSRDGLAVILRFDDIASVAQGFEDAGYPRPSSDDLSGEVWSGSSDLVNRLGLTTFELTHVAFLEEEGLMIGSDKAGYLETAVEAARGEADGLDLDGLSPEGDPLAVTAFLEDYACEALTMNEADDDARAVAAALVEEAGGVSPLKGYLVAVGADRAISIVLAFEDDDQAERNLGPRRSLAGAEDPGQRVAYEDVFEVTDAERDGRHVVLTGKALEDAYPMTNLATGPVLLAYC